MGLFGLLSQPPYLIFITFKRLSINFFLLKHKNSPLVKTKVFNMYEEGASKAAAPERRGCGLECRSNGTR